jgi:mRNA interferase MazF
VITRGDVWVAGLDPTKGAEISGARPVVVVSRDAINLSSPLVIVVPVTGRENKLKIYPSHVILAAGDGGLTKESVAVCEQVRAVQSSRLTKQLGHLAPPSIAAIGAALKIALDL